MPLFSWEKLTDAKVIALTPNSRIARQLTHQYDRYQQNIGGGKKTWATVVILSVDEWLADMWRRWSNRPPLLLLNQYQEKILWGKIITGLRNDNEFMNVRSLANLAQKAWEFIQKWQVDLDWPETANNFDCNAFQNWAKKFLSICEKNHFLDCNRLANLIGSAIKTQEIPLCNNTVFLLNFDEMSRQFNELFSIIKENNKVIRFDFPLNKNSSEYRINFNDQDDEILAMARWVKDRGSQNKDATIGCLVTNLDMRRNKITAVIKEIFPITAFNIGLGESLDSFAIIHNALLLLKLSNLETETVIELAFIIELLRSPFVKGAEEELMQRVQSEADIRTTGKTHLTWEEFYKHLEICPQLFDALNKQREYLVGNKQKKSLPSQWVHGFMEQLKILGWPGERNLSEVENKILAKWQNVLKKLCTLDLIIGSVLFSEVQKLLTELVANTFFQSASRTSISILETHTALGMSFDHLWIMGMTSESWPPQTSPNPFIPIKLQKNIRRTSGEIITERIRNSGEIIYSLSPGPGEQFVEISPFLTAIPEIKQDDLKLSSFTSTLTNIYQTQRLETFTDEKAPELAAKEKFQGGSKVLELQMLCPFRAFAECRLKAQEFPEPQFGISRNEHGILLHTILEQIWRSLETKKHLDQLEETALREIITKNVDDALTAYKETHRECAGALINIERLCLIKQLEFWLNAEKDRVGFQVIATEKSDTVNIGPLKLKLRIDRIDQLLDGSLIVIDYKTGKNVPSIFNWFADCPENLQLPLYSISSLEPISGLVLAKVNIDAAGFVGITKNANQIPNVSDLSMLEKYKLSANWDEWQTSWRQTFEKLALDFYIGNATVNPKNPVKTCNFCSISSICRKNNLPC